MRVAKLSLERFGRFDGCDLSFRSGAPDLHVIYGANEAGKTTSMAAVSDLLFGFEMRSPYNFAFGYPLLRIGAVLEEDGRSLAVRRRKANAATLVDADDKPIDEAPMIAMLHGQTRETFRAAFSLDHVRLRQGGRAIVEAKDDVGQALFAAGSGMTGITAALRALEDEAEAIWGPRAKKGRTYSQAASAYEVSTKAVRDQQVRPKVWSDARAALEQAEDEQRRLEGERQALLTDQRRVERLRRIGPAMQRRAELRALLDTKQDVVEIAPAREERLLASLADAETAERARQTAATLLAELEEAIARIPVDPAILAQAERIDRLVERRGAIEEARSESVRLDAERKAKIDRLNELRRDIGLGEQDLPSRPLVARLRELVREHASASAELRTIGQAEAESADRLRELERKIDVDAAPPELAELGAAVEMARRLGDDIDERCAAAARAATRAREELGIALQRLVPWSGSVDALRGLPLISSAKIDGADANLAAARTRVKEAAEAGQRASDELEELELRRTGLVERGHAIPKDDLLEAREARDAEWWDIQQHVRGAAQLDDPAAASDRFDDLLEQADALADRRFASAETSGQLALVEQQRTELTLRRAQAAERGRIVEVSLQVELETWRGRLEVAGLPGLEPTRLRAWLIERDTALAAAASALKAEDARDAELSRRDASRRALLSRLPSYA